MRTITLFASIMLAILFANQTLAQHHNEKFNRCFYSMDSDGNGEVSPAEFHTAIPSAPEAFTAADTSKDGVLDHDEWENFKSVKGIEDSHHD